jgi:hypothetical protein
MPQWVGNCEGEVIAGGTASEGLFSEKEVVEESLHLAGGVGVAGVTGGFEAGLEAGDGFFGAAEFGEGLRGHLVGGDVVGIVADEGGELGEGGFGATLAEVFHGEAVAGEGVGGVELKEFIAGCDLVHASMVGGGLWGWQVGKAPAVDRADHTGEGVTVIQGRRTEKS